MPEEILLPAQKDTEIKKLEGGSVAIIHLSEESAKSTYQFINSLIKSLGLVEQGFVLLPE